MNAYIKIEKFEVDDVITTSGIFSPIIWGDGNTTPPTTED